MSQPAGGSLFGAGGRAGGSAGEGMNGGSSTANGGGDSLEAGAGSGFGGSDSVDAGGMGGEGGSEHEPPEPPEIDCGEAPIVTGTFTKEGLRGAASDCAMWHYCQFENSSSRLSSAVRAYSEHPNDATLGDAQQAFRDAMSMWSRIELFQFGPLSSRSLSAGKDSYQGQGLRELIHAWPSTARCRVEEQLANQAYVSKGVSSALISARGLFGIEYSLFYPGADTACAATSSAGQVWPTLSQDELAHRKRDYALALSEDVLARARELSRAWATEGGNFKSVFVSTSGYPNEQEALNVLGFALIYVEREVKDWKLGIPAGYTLTHPVSDPETPFALLGTENVRANLSGFRSLFEGCGAAGEGLGFDDWLVEAGHPELAGDILSALSRAQATAEATPPLHVASLAEIDTLYWAVKGLTDLLKADLFGAGSPLNLKLPAGVEGDTD